jgi:hypothetical protein
LTTLKKIAHYLARKNFCRTAIDEHADLSAFKEKLSRPMVAGLILMAFSYTIGLPTVLLFAAIAAAMHEPLIGIIGGALIYGISTLIFFVGLKMVGIKYFMVMNRWLTRIILEKILGPEAKASCALPDKGSESGQPKN